ncbi:hypothetical protein PV325_010741 [Microctonus aethiopoides]|uniref:Uncharacterized protein n=1 Tax=Microctonus aethiopoides TaxID=144406 RepID=A0AA39FYA9_9HYME|nr:hypothetical protein PV325_010741 [Microctonus aethiopoides]KAK0178097.1 hypothetical protein PV328_002078 [Microctonus aethiopoides]
MSWISEQTCSKSQYFIYPSQLSNNSDNQSIEMISKHNPKKFTKHYQFEYQYESQLSSVTCSCDELTNEDLYDSMQVADSNSSYTSDDFSLYSNNEVSSEKYSINDAMLSQQLIEGQNQYEMKENKCIFSMPMTFQRDSIPKSLLTTPRLYNENDQLDTFLDDIDEIISEDDQINLSRQKLDNEKLNCELKLKMSKAKLINNKSETSVNILNKSEKMNRKKRNRSPFTIYDDDSRVPMPSQSINESKNIELSSIRNCDDDNELKSSDLYKKYKTFGGWIKNLTKIILQKFKWKKSSRKSIKVLFENNKYSCSNSSRNNVDKQIHYCNCDGEKIVFHLKERLRRGNLDDLWVQDIIPVDDLNDINSRYCLFFVKKARVAMATANKKENYSSSASSHSDSIISSSSETDIECKCLFENPAYISKKLPSNYHTKLSPNNFCLRMYNLFFS